MNYHLLTGATGLLGRYLLRDLLLADVPVAVLVRPTRKLSAEERIESIVHYWEQQLGRELPRPVTFVGDITEPDLGLDEAESSWVAQNCTALIHSAASLSFYSTGPGTEPWRSNVGGVQNVLDFCEQTGITSLHHVSTAYMCGLRHGVVLESEVDEGQQPGNDYEQSKLEAEKLVRSCPHLERLTVYRPAIIVGDSETGFTTTFHGFYVALQLSNILVKSSRANETGKFDPGVSRFTLNGDERKNLVPVDWVSAVMSHIITNPEHHGRTYHLTPRHPVTVRLVRDVLEESNGFYGATFAGPGMELEELTEIEQLFYEHISEYNSYWRDDPEFDCTNTRLAAPHLQCPHVDRSMLLRLSHAAIDVSFSWNDRPVRQLSKVPV